MSNSLPQNIEQLNLPPDTEWSGAVCFLILEDSIVFIRRSEQMPSHKGQVAFFGGHRNPGDLSPKETAFREFAEESGIASNNLEYLGLARPTRTSRKNLLIPVVCKLNMSEQVFRETAYSNGEWTVLLIVNISVLTDLSGWQSGAYHGSSGQTDSIVFLPIQDISSGERDLLWGATGKIVFNAVNILSNLNLKN